MTAGIKMMTVPSQVAEAFGEARHLTVMERLALAKLLLESVLVSELSEETDWSARGLAAFQKDWDNAEDAIYDNWREQYGVPTR